MRAALLADTHMPRGKRRLPDACLEIVAIGPPLVAVHGNVDVPMLAKRLPRPLIELD